MKGIARENFSLAFSCVNISEHFSFVRLATVRLFIQLIQTLLIHFFTVSLTTYLIKKGGREKNDFCYCYNHTKTPNFPFNLSFENAVFNTTRYGLYTLT